MVKRTTSILILILALLVSPSWAVVTKEALTASTYYKDDTVAPWLPQPDANEGVVFYETLENPTATAYWDNAGWTNSGGDPDNAFTHTGHGSEVLKVVQGSGTGAYSSIDIGTPASGVLRTYFEIDAWPTANRNFVYLRNGANNSMRLMALAAGSLRAVIIAGTNKTCESTNIGIDTWYRVEMNQKASNPMIHLYSDAGAQIAWTTGGSGTGNYDCTTATPTYGTCDTIMLGDDGSVTNGGLTTWYDDVVVRQYDAEVGDWAASDIVATADDNKYFTATGGVERYLRFNTSAATESDTLKGFRVWVRGKQYSETQYKDRIVATYNAGAGVKNFIAQYDATSAFKDYYYNFIAHTSHDQHSGSQAVTTMDWNDLPLPVGVVKANNVIQGGKIDKIWAEAIRGVTGDAYVTHEPYFGGTTATSTKVWLRINEDQYVRLRYSADTDCSDPTSASCELTQGTTCTTNGTCWPDVNGTHVTSTTNFSTIFEVTGLTANTKYYFDVDIKQYDASWLSTFAFENPENAYWNILSAITTFPTDGTATNYHWAASGDWHDQPAHHELWKSISDKGAKFFYDLGDQYILDDLTATGWGSPTYEEFLAMIYDRRGFHADASWYSQYISSQMPVVRMWSDHDGPGFNNNNKIGAFDYDQAVSFTPGYRSYVAFKRTQPMYPLPVATDLGEAYYDDSVSGIPVTTADATGTVFKTTTTIPMTGTDGIYPGMVLINHSNGTPVSWGVIRNIILNGSTYEVYLCEPLTGGTIDDDFDVGDDISIQRGMLANKFIYGNTEIISADVRRKRDPNGTPGIDKLDAVSFPFQSLLISKDLNDDGTFGDYLTPQTGTTETLIKHTGTTVEAKVPKWDLVQVSNAKAAADFTLESGSLYYTATNSFPTKPMSVHRVTTSGSYTKMIFEVNQKSMMNGIDDWWYDWTNHRVYIWTTSYIDATHPVEIVKGYSLAKTVQNSPQPTISYFGSASTPVDNTTNTTRYTAVTPPASMLTGDLVIMEAEKRSNTSSLNIYNAGGQTWNSLTALTSSTTLRTRMYWATFNGTWSANPSVDFTNTSTPNTLVMHVFRPTFTDSTWSIDVTQVGTTYTAPTSPYLVCINPSGTSPACTTSPLTTVADNAVVVGTWGSIDDNTWGTPAGSSGTWYNLGSTQQYRNTSGSQQSLTFAYKYMPSAGAVGTISRNESVNGGDAGTRAIISFKENQAASSYGNIELEWAIENLSTSDRVRFYESGASDWATDTLNINHGHVQRTFLEAALRDDEVDWKVMIQETPLKGEEIMQRDKWGDSDGMALWRKLYYDATNGYDFTVVDTTYCSGGAYCSNTTFTDSSGNALKPGGVFGFYDPGNLDDSGARDGGLYEVSTYATLINPGQWWWDATNKKVCICSPADYSASKHIMVFKPAFWERSSSRKYILEKYGSANVYDVSADRHFAALDDAANSYDPWPTAGCSPTHVDTGSHFCGKKWQVNGKNAWYDSGIGWVPSYSSPGWDNVRQAGFCDINVDNTNQQVHITICERNGQTITNDPAVNTENTQDEWIAGTWLGNMVLDIAFVCPFGNCDYFNRGNSDTIDGSSPMNWIDDQADLDILSNEVVNGTDNTTGISHWATSLGVGAINQYAQTKITSTSTDGDVGVILRSLLATGTADNRYAVVYDKCYNYPTCSQHRLKLQSYDWNSYLGELASVDVSPDIDTSVNPAWLSVTIQDSGSNVTANIWVDTAEPNYQPFSANAWQDVTDVCPATNCYQLTGASNSASGTYVGIIIKDETGAASPVLDNFYSGNVELAGATGAMINYIKYRRNN